MSHATLLIVRGIVSLVIGFAIFMWPGITLIVLVALFAAYAFLDGAVNLIHGFTPSGASRRSWTQVLLGCVGLAAAAVAITMPGLTLLALVLFIGIWAIARGVLDLVGAVRLRKVIAGEWLLALAGAMSIVFGLLVFFFPAAGAFGIAWLLGAYAAAWGVVLIALGVQLRRTIGA